MLLWTWLACWNTWAGGASLTLNANDILIDLQPAARLWYDARADRTLSDWQQAMQSAAGAKASALGTPGFEWMDARQMPLGRRTGAVWVAIDLISPQGPLARHLVVSPPRLEQVDAWLLTGPGNGQAQPLGRAGLSVPLMERPFNASAVAWALNVPQGPSTLLLRIQGRTNLQPEIKLWEPQAHTLDIRRADLHNGMQSGALVLAALMTLVFSLWLREFTWVWYGLTCLSLLFYEACFSGQAMFWMWPQHPQWTLPILSLAVAGIHVCTTLFVLSFIPQRHVATASRISAQGLAGVSTLGLILTVLIDFQTGIVLQELTGLFLPLVILWIAWRAWQQGDGPSRFVLLSFGMLSIASILRTATVQRWLTNESWVDSQFFPVGAILTSCVLMLAMADRIRLLVQQQALVTQRHQETLENRIRDATVELIRARDEAQSAVQFKQRFLSRVSHDLRTPLHTLLGNSGLARRFLAQLPTNPGTGASQVQLMECMDSVERSTSEILQLSNELLELARGEAGQLDLKIAPTSLPALMQDVASTARWLVQHQHNQLRVQTELAVPWVMADADRLKQVLRNLLANACTATRDGVITLGIRSAPGAANPLAQVEFWVDDTGRGIPPDALPRIFEPFEQLDANSATGAAGLGLAIAQQWVNLMGSDIAVQSTPGVGSHFSWVMQVPVATEVAPLDPPDPEEPEEDSQPLQGHVLIVDDLESHRLLLQGLLQAMGLQVSLASGGQAAVRLLQKQDSGAPAGSTDVFSPVDLVITDQDMSDGDGASLLQWCRQNRPGLAVVGLSGTTPSSTPFDAFLLKPATLEQLHPILQRLLSPAVDWAQLRQLAARGDGLGVDAWIAEHRQQLGTSPLALGAVKLSQSLQLAALVRWLNKPDAAK